MSTPDPGHGGRGGGRRGGGGKRGGRCRRPGRGSGQPRTAVTSKQDALLTALLPPGYDKTKADALKITATGSGAAHRVNTALTTLSALQREGGGPRGRRGPPTSSRPVGAAGASQSLRRTLTRNACHSPVWSRRA